MNKLDPRNIYDDLHQIPELGFEEFKTSAYLADKLEAMGYKVTRNIGGTGVIGEIKGSEPGPVMMLRADMDARRKEKYSCLRPRRPFRHAFSRCLRAGRQG